MKSKIFFAIITMFAGSLLTSCEDHSYPLGLPEYDHHYYIAYVPYNNTAVTVNKSQTALLKFEVSFNSSFTRDYDAVAQYVITPGTIAGTTPAALGTDFNIVDENGSVIQPVDGRYSITFPHAIKARDTIYVKLLNNPAAGTRSVNIDLIEHTTEQYTVDTMSVAFRRPLKIQ